MRRELTSALSAVALLVSVVVVQQVAAPPAAAAPVAFSNTASIALRDPNFGGNPNCSGSSTLCNATAGTYPSPISVSGTTGTISSVSLSLNNVSYSYSDDIDALLVGPGGQSLIVVAAVGPNTGAGEAASSSTLTISDAGTVPTDLQAWGSAPDFKPANFGSYGFGNSVNGFNESFPSPAPAQPWGDPGQNGTNATLANTFNGLNANGTWNLYVITTSEGDGTGAVAGGWTLNITTAAAATPTTTALASAPNPSFTAGASSSVTLTATVSSTSTVNAGTVDFTDGGVAIPGCGNQPVTSGVATCTTTFTAEGNHDLEALYGGTGTLGASNATLTQEVDNHTTVTGTTFCNTGLIGLNNPASTVADASPYPSRIFVSGLTTLSHIAVTLKGVTYSQSQDIDVLLVGPGGQTLILAADAGPNSAGAISNVTLTLDDSASSTLSSTAIWGAPSSTVTSKPVNYGGLNETFGAPAPAGPYGNPGPSGGGTDTLGTAFDGINPNGTWSLYAITTAAGDGSGAIAGGWCANLTAGAAAATNTSIASNNNPSFTASPGNTVTFTATVTKASDSSALNEGTVDFTSNGASISGCAAEAVVNGQATCTTAFPQERSYAVEALYSGDSTFGPSHDSLTQVANDHTSVVGNNYCNTGAITLNNPATSLADATPYPSNIFVTGRGGGLLHLSVTLKSVTYSESQDIDALLVGPGGQTLLLAAAAGPNSSGAIGNVTLTLDDNATSTLSSTAIWGAPNASVTSKPFNYGGLNENFGSPAPAGPYGNPGPFGGGTATLGSTFNGTSPNGTWSLYMITTAAGDGTGAVNGGWCLNVTTPAPPTVSTSFTPSTIAVGQNSALSFTVSNPNATTTLHGVGFTDTLPSGMTVATPNGVVGSCGGGTLTAAAGGSTLSLSGSTLAPGASCAFSVDVTATSAGTLVNTTSAPTSTEGGGGTAASASLVVVAPPSLDVSFSPSTIVLGQNSTLSFTVANPNSSETLTGIAFDDTLPAGLVVATPNGLTGSCGGGTITATAGSGSISLSGATLSASASCTFSVDVTATSTGTKADTVSDLTSNEGGAGQSAGDTLTVNAEPVTLAMAFGAATIPVNGSTTLTYTITNPTGNGAETGIGLTDSLPAGLVVATPNGLTGSCGSGTVAAIAGSGVITLSAGTLADGGACQFTVDVTGASAGVQDNSATVSSTEGGTGNTPTASITVVAAPTIAVAFGAGSISVDASTSLTFTITNPNTTVGLSGVAVSDALPSGLIVSTPNGLTGSCGSGTITATAGGSSISLSGATLSASASCTFSVKITGMQAGAYTDTTGAVTSTEGGTGTTASDTLDVTAGPALIGLAFGSTTVPLNGSTSLTYTIDNPTGNGTETGIAFTDTLPAGLVVATPNGVSSTCTGTVTAVAGSGTVTLTGASLSDGGSCVISINITGTTAGAKSNSVTVSSSEGGTGNTATASLTVVAPPTIAIAFGASSIPLNGSTSLSVTVGNPNSTVGLSGVDVTDALPSGLQVSTPNGLTGSCGSGTITAIPGTSTVILTGATVSSSASCTFSVNITGVAAGSWTNTTGAVSSTEGGTGGTGSDTIAVVAPPVIAKAFGATSVAVNGTTSLTFTLTNPAANTVVETGVGFDDTFPSGLIVATPSGSASDCADATIIAVPGSAEVTASGIQIAVGGQCTISLNVVGTTSGTRTNSVTVSSTNGGIGNTAMATLTVASPPSITEAFGASSVPVGGSTSLTFAIDNPNTGIALGGVAFTDSLPSGLVVSTPNGVTGSCDGGTITAVAGASTISLAGANLGDGATCTFSVDVTGVTAGQDSNSVTVTSTTGGDGNTATASITVVAPPTLSKTFGASSVPLNGSTSLTFTIDNPNSGAGLTGVGFTDSLPAGMVISTPNGLTGSCGSGTVTAVAGGSSVALSGGTLDASASCTFSANVTGTSAGTLANTTSVISSVEGGTGPAATASLVVVAPPTLSKAFGTGTIPLNGTTSLTFTLANPAANTVAETGVAFTDTFPSGLVISTPANAASTCADVDAIATAGTSTVTASGILIPVGGTCTISLNVTGTASGSLTNTTGPVSSTNGGTGLTATATLRVASPPAIAVTFGSPSIPLNGSTSLAFTVTNPNSGIALDDVAFTDALPAGLVVSTPNALTGSCGGGTIAAVAGGSSVTLTGATLAASASCTFSVKVTGVTAGVQNDSVAVTSSTAGAGNTATASLTVIAPPTISKAFGAGSIPFGDSTSLTFTVVNPNTFAGLTGVAVTDAFPTGLVVAAPNGLTGGCGTGTITAVPGTSTVILSDATVGAGSSCTFAVNVTGVRLGNHSNTTGAVTSTNGGTGGKATASIDVLRAPTTTVVSTSTGSPMFGAPLTFTATVTPSQPNGSGVNPTGTVTFYLNGATTPVEVSTLSGGGTATFSSPALPAGINHVRAVYSGDSLFRSSGSVGAATIGCTVTITGTHVGAVTVNHGSLCVIGGTVKGSITISGGASVDLEHATITGTMSAMGGGGFRMCGSTAPFVNIALAQSFVVVGDAKDGCAPNVVNGPAVVIDNHHGVQVIGNTINAGIFALMNTGSGPFPDDLVATISGNHR